MMNDGEEDKMIYARVVYEVVEGEHAKGFVQSKSFKLDVGACGSSEVPAEMHGQYSQKSPVFTSSISGTLLYTTGHMHDGGQFLSLPHSLTPSFLAPFFQRFV